MIGSRRPLSSRWVTGVVAAVAIAALVGAAVFLGPKWRLRNQGEDTPCSAFQDMSPQQRARVIDKMGYAKELTTNARQVADALQGCRTEPEDETLEYALGP